MKKKNSCALYPRPKGRGFTAWRDKVFRIIPYDLYHSLEELDNKLNKRIQNHEVIEPL
jgi:hypothetical protein